MVPSFSSGAKVQVEYTSVPPSRSISAALSRIEAWRAAHIFTFSTLHSAEAAGSFRNIPSPEQGASTRIRSKYPGNLPASVSESVLVTIQLRIPRRSTFWDSIPALSG